MTSAVTPVRVSGAAGILAAVPTMMGFHPADSLVMICLNGGRVGPVARVDLDEVAAASQLAAHAERHGDSVILITYSDTLTRKPASLLALEKALTVPVRDIIRTGNGAVEAHPELAAHSVAAGRGVLASRSALTESIAARADAAHTWADLTPVDEADVDALAASCLFLIGMGELPSVTAQKLVATINSDVDVRDALIAVAVLDTDEPWLPVLISAAQQTPDVHAADLCAVLAVVAYRHGDGALAQVALDRVYATRPEHRLARLTRGIIAAGLDPESFAQAVAGGL